MLLFENTFKLDYKKKHVCMEMLTNSAKLSKTEIYKISKIFLKSYSKYLSIQK